MDLLQGRPLGQIQAFFKCFSTAHGTCEQDGDSLPRKPDGLEVAIKVMQANDEEELRARRREFDILSTLLGDSSV